MWAYSSIFSFTLSNSFLMGYLKAWVFQCLKQIEYFIFYLKRFFRMRLAVLRLVPNFLTFDEKCSSFKLITVCRTGSPANVPPLLSSACQGGEIKPLDLIASFYSFMVACSMSNCIYQFFSNRKVHKLLLNKFL